jgi:hypothetical protein
MAVDNICVPRSIDRRRGSDDAHLLIGKALGEIIRRENRTESYVACPPACYITDDDGAIFTLGFEYIEHRFKYEFMVLRNDVPTGQFAERIEYTRRAGHSGTVRLFGKDGVRTFSRNKSCFI